MLSSTVRRAAIIACCTSLLACGNDPDDPQGNTELRVLVWDGSSGVDTVEYTLMCDGGIPGEYSTIEGAFPTLDEDSTPAEGEGEVFEAFLDLPPGQCLIQLRGRDDDGEVLCTAQESFEVRAFREPSTTVNLLLQCTVERLPRPPLPQPARNACPDLFPFECAEFDDGATGTSCEVKFRDSDDTCGDACDPQTCMVEPTGIACTPGPDPGVSSLVTCDADALDCAGDGILDESCTFRETDQQFAVDCQPLDGEDFSGATISCTVVTTDGDVDCDKTKTVEVECPAQSP